MGVAMVSGLALVGVAPASAVSSSAKSTFLSSVVGPAQQAQRKLGVPASVSIAQAIVASDWGTSSLAKQAKNYFNTQCSGLMTASQYANLAEAQLGKPYVLGANGPNQFDCSSLVIWVNNQSGAYRMSDDTAAGMYNRSRAVSGSPKVGDMVFLRNNPARSNGIGHMAVLTEKLSNGDWRIIEARGRAYGVVRSTLSYWRQRSYYAGLRRLAKITFASSGTVTASAARLYQSGCINISSEQYAKFSSVTNSFYGHAAAVTSDSVYKSARAVINDTPKYVDAVAKVERPKDAAAYAKTLNELIATYKLTDYDVVPFDLVLLSGNKGTKVTALQHLLRAGGTSVKPTGVYDSATASAVRKYQSAKKLQKDGEAGPVTLGSLFGAVSSGTTGDRVAALHSLLAAIGLSTTPGSTAGQDTVASIKAFQATAGRSASGVADANTWAMLFMTPDQAPVPTLAGTAQVTQTITATAGKWGPGTFSLSYQWLRNLAPISGATAASYTLQPADAGTSISVAVTGTRPGYTTVTRRSVPIGSVDKAKLVATPTPTVTGQAVVGQSLTAVPGTWSPAPVTLTYQWFRGATAIPAATGASYAVQVTDLGAKLTVTVSGWKTGYHAVGKTSGTTAAVAPGTLSAAPTPKVSGKAAVGQELTAESGTWAPAPVALAYQWYRGKTAIKGATASTYALVDADARSTITVKVTGSRAGFTSVSKTSAATAAVTANQLTVGKPKVTGTARVGKTVKVSAGSWGPAPVKLSYRWYRSSKAISGATKSSYKLKSTDKGKTITIKVSGSKDGFTSASAKASVKVK